MRKRNKKLLSVLACAGVLATAGASVAEVSTNSILNQTVQAAKKSVKARSYGVDVASYQSTNLSSHANAGAQFAIVKVSEGTGYRNPKAAAQIKSAISNGMMPMAYHFATFGANSSAAKAEAKYAVSSAKALGLPNGSYIACDWETGQGNNVNGGKNGSANAIIAFMKQVKASGFQSLLYSGAHLLKNNINTNKVNNAFPNSLWVASYATMGRIDNPNFAYFPSMDGVAIWQFTDNWRGLNVDGNITLLPLSYGNGSSQAPKATSVKNKKTVMHKAAVYDKNGNKTGKTVKAYKKVTVLGGVVTIKGTKYYRTGKNSYIKVANVDGTPRQLKKSGLVFDKNGKITKAPTIMANTTVATYGKKNIGGVEYYKINKNRYVKVSDFK
ncbi:MULTISPECIES: GH25 family lysozyme [Lactobacillus]|uniref:Lysin n=1 Tax=Lactobacillus xujianguonis TaxID=2495899 RepID=A0A437STG2_9LACO|nr:MULTISPECIES: GH25 family lysozyme [Lactobacillus]RVU70213.1 lysin [Lactobacillus xujianguonis]RVU73389.1 lysin [Lactobacillus xujianguonis]